MKTLSVFVLAFALLSTGGDPRRGLELYGAGRFAEAAVEFEAALAADPGNAELAYNLALARWRAGEPDAAEIAAEKAAALSSGRLNALRDGLLGNVRYQAARATEDPGQGLELAKQARDHFLRGALAPDSGDELSRNLERAERLIDELEKKLEEQEQEEQEPNEQQDEQQQDEREQEQEEQQQNEQNQDESRQSEPQPEPPQEQEQGEQREQQAQDQESNSRSEQPQLSPQERKRLLDLLEQFEQERQRYRAATEARRPRVEKDW